MVSPDSPLSIFHDVPRAGERRLRLRHKVHSPAFASFNDLAGGMVLDLSEILDLSESGMSILTSSPLTPDRNLSLVLDLPETRTYINTSGLVAWADQSGRAGIRFSQMSDTNQCQLKQWLLFNALTALAKRNTEEQKQETREEPEVSTPETTSQAAAEVAETPVTTAVPLDDQLPYLVADAPTLNDIRHQVEALGSDLGAALHIIVGCAQAMTRAVGAAIALAQESEMVCRASAGEAPGLGARFQVGSGISGECVRSGKAQRCDDAEVDPLVDRESCRQLGIRSMLAEPVISSGEVVGLLEIFSPHPFAFGETDGVALHRLAQMTVQAMESAAIWPRPWQPIQPESNAVVSDEIAQLQEREEITPPPRTRNRALRIFLGAMLVIVVGALLTPWLLRLHNSAKASAPVAKIDSQSVAAQIPQEKALGPTPLDDLRRWANQGDPVAQYALGARYAQGDEVKQDFAEAVRWFEKAAEQGHVVAQATLGAYYWAGRGVPQDLSKAYFWSALARAGGDEASKYRVAALTSRMTRTQVAEAQQRANEWISQHQGSETPAH